MNDKLKEQIAARKEQKQNMKKRGPKPNTQKKDTPPKEDPVVKDEDIIATDKEQENTPLQEASQEPLQDVLEQDSTQVSLEQENASETITEPSKVIQQVSVEPDGSIDFTNGKSWPTKQVTIGGYSTQEGAFLDKMMREVFYILSLGGKFDRSVMPSLKIRPYVVKMKVPVDVYQDYINRVGYPDYEDSKEYYSSTITSIDTRTLMDVLEKNVQKGIEIDPKAVVSNIPRYTVSIRTRHPVESKPGWHCKQREAIKYSREELDSMEWYQIVAIKELYGIISTNRLGVVTELEKVMEKF